VEILRTAHGPTPHPQLDEVLSALRRHWLGIARRKYPVLRDEADDAIQTALVKLLAAVARDEPKDVDKAEVWARSIFVNTALDLIRERHRHDHRRVYVGQWGDDPEDALRRDLPAEGPAPEEAMAGRERLRIVARCVESLEVARLKFVDGLPDKEIARRQRLTRDGVAGQLKRFRKALRDRLREPE